ncbi:hypothetical protein, variant [Puccinia triticina 1-1 BBBD Race 1]|uniref:Uncharacterized protein n=2 Tax=Puccinia triticina TaxID=208348 RepID=A0A180GYE0_PUCT1|nr:uncharacterized protein PtA15_12A118 [Puccinia triticina]OAV97534.1 hypothetical protein, variant [Puccinia triticina 1-1 BBBD Race 1]WAQ90132.1 hypothetical protein PtA15_12A118 [Puccinia triticina]
MLFLFTRVGPNGQSSAPETSSSWMLNASSRDLRKAKSTPILRINGTTPTTAGAPSPETTSAGIATDSLGVPSSLTGPALSTSTAVRLACPKPPHISDQAQNKHASFTRKIRYRLSSFNRGPGSPLLQQAATSPTRPDDFSPPVSYSHGSCTMHSSGSMSPTTEKYPSKLYDDAKAVPARESRDRSQSVLEQRSPSYASMTFFKDGLNKAHKFFGRALEGFSDKDSDEDVSDESHDEDEEDLNMLYSNVMVPLEFPGEDDGETTSSSSSPFEPDFDKKVGQTTSPEDSTPSYYFKKQSSSCSLKKNNLLAPQASEPLSASLGSDLYPEMTTTSNPYSITSQQCHDVKLQII